MSVNEYDFIACICEGAAEQAIMELLLENNKLYFRKENLLDEKIIRTRSATKFEETYLRKHFDKKITVLRILDSRKEKFKLSKLYRDKVNVEDIITAPEIEMLIIHHEKMYKEFKKSKQKPSDFCKQYLKYPKVKEYSFVKSYFSNINHLLNAIEEYHSKAMSPKGEKSLYDLLDKQKHQEIEKVQGSYTDNVMSKNATCIYAKT